MRTMLRAALFAASTCVLGGVVGGAAMAGTVERACLNSDRPGASRALCGCIQDVADLTLTRSDQRMAAKFFKDPQMAQDIRMSKKDSHNEFWARYKNFGQTAAAFCGAGG